MTMRLMSFAPVRAALADRRGAIAVLFALMLVPILLAAGGAVDYGRLLVLRTSLQGAVDAAALAGASAYVGATAGTSATTVANNSMTASIGQLPNHAGSVPFTASPSVTTLSNGATAYTMTVTARATMSTSLMALITNSLGAAVTATAINPVVKANANIGNWSSSAWDRNTIYWYIVPTNGSLPTLSSSNIVYSNAPGFDNTHPSVPTAQASQRIGFALKNITGGNTGYGTNGEGASQGTTHVFYSHLNPPSAQATDSTDSVSTCSHGHCTSHNPETYSTLTQNCALQVLVGTPSSSPSGSCGSTQKYAAPSCSQLGGQTVKFFWNDMGGGSDDFDYNDAVYTVSCASAGSGAGGSGPTSVVLVQ